MSRNFALVALAAAVLGACGGATPIPQPANGSPKSPTSPTAGFDDFQADGSYGGCPGTAPTDGVELAGSSFTVKWEDNGVAADHSISWVVEEFTGGVRAYWKFTDGTVSAPLLLGPYAEVVTSGGHELMDFGDVDEVVAHVRLSSPDGFDFTGRNLQLSERNCQTVLALDVINPDTRHIYNGLCQAPDGSYSAWTSYSAAGAWERNVVVYDVVNGVWTPTGAVLAGQGPAIGTLDAIARC